MNTPDLTKAHPPKPREDLEKMPVEDASIEWPENESAYRPVAKLYDSRSECL